MKTPMSYLEDAAREERLAERTREDAEANWRTAWWRTTMALAQAGPDRSAVSAAFDTAERILGQDRSYLSTRRIVGQKLIYLKVDQLAALPPRLTIEYIRSGGDPDSTVTYITAAEREGVSLRELSVRLGSQVPSWERQDERTATDEQVREALLDPQRADRVLADPQVRSHANEALSRSYQRDHVEIPPQERTHNDDQREMLDVVGDFHVIRDKMLRIATILGNSRVLHTDETYRQAVEMGIKYGRQRLDAIESILEGGESLDQALARMTAGES
jgi:hypothetical protein